MDKNHYFDEYTLYFDTLPDYGMTKEEKPGELLIKEHLQGGPKRSL